jgi:transcriptional regulator with XRE-family HTH domain
MRNHNKRIHNYLRRCRKQRGLKQKDVADILGLVSASMISRWEKGLSLPETHNALRMAALYHTTVDFIYQDLRLDMQDELDARLDALKTRGGGRV